MPYNFKNPWPCFSDDMLLTWEVFLNGFWSTFPLRDEITASDEDIAAATDVTDDI